MLSFTAVVFVMHVVVAAFDVLQGVSILLGSALVSSVFLYIDIPL